MKFAFIIMGELDPRQDQATIGNGSVKTVGVANLDQACRVAQELAAEGVDCIELCGAFGEAGARKIIAATTNKIPVGFVIHLPEQEPLFKALFG